MSWSQWPTRSSDPGVNFVAIVAVLVIGLLAIIVFGTIAAIGLAAFLIWKAVQWYMNRPVPTDVLATQTQQRAITANFPETKQFMLNAIERILESSEGRYPTNSVYMFLIEALRRLYDGEGLDNMIAPVPPRNTIEEGRYRDRLLAHMKKTGDAPRTLRAVGDTLGRLGRDIIAHLPPMAVETMEQFTADNRPEPFATVPLVDALSDVRPFVKDILLPFFNKEVEELDLFSSVRNQLAENFNNCGQVFPEKFKGSPREVVTAYLQNTFFEELFDAPIPFSVSISKQLEHTMIVGGTRWGKSQLIGSIVNQHLQSQKPPSIILIDSTGDFLQKIQRLALFDPEHGRLKDRLVIIDPEDENPPALNMFDVSALRQKNYTPQQLEQVEADIIDLFDYVFETLGAGMTSRQATGFSFLCRLLISIPGSDIRSLRQLLQSDADSYAKVPAEVRQAIERLDETTQDFFKHQFFTRATQATRRQIASRLFDIVRVPAFERMFSGVNKVDFFEAMQTGKIILVNTSKAALKPDASALFGRYIIARVLSGAFERVVIPMDQRRPCLMFVDEAQEYFDASMDTLLTQVAKFKLGICIAFQYADQLDQKLRASVLGNTTVKYVGGVTFADARHLAREMRTTELMIQAQKKDPAEPPKWAQFATFVRNYTEQALSVTIPFYALENQAKMSEEAFAKMMERNRQRVGSPRVQQKAEETTSAPEPAVAQATAPEPKAPPQGDGDESDKAQKSW